MWSDDLIDLTIKGGRCRACRNVAVWLAFVLTVLIAWQDWNGLFFLLPGVITLYAVLAQINLFMVGVASRHSEELCNYLIFLDFREKVHRARRNGALFLAFGLAALIGWQGWNRLLLLLPAVIALYAAIAQVNVRLIAAELKRRTSED
jgi:asparagine N-glycosylation enzyme membrane subunit Stt3